MARQLGVGRIQVARWRGCFAAGGVEAMQADLPRRGRKPRINAAEIVSLLTQTKSVRAGRGLHRNRSPC